MRRLIMFLILLGCGLAGCASIPFAVPEPTATRQLAATELLGTGWDADGKVFRLRQSGLFEAHGRRLVLDGLIQLDTPKQSARLVGMNELGVKIFDLSVTPTVTIENFLLPELAATPGLAAAVGGAVRRIYLAPRPAATDRLTIGAEEYRLDRRTDGGVLTFTFGGREPLLQRTRMKSAAEDWQVGYYEYRFLAGRWLPGGVILEDRRAGYRLTLWLEEAKQVDE